MAGERYHEVLPCVKHSHVNQEFPRHPQGPYTITYLGLGLQNFQKHLEILKVWYNKRRGTFR